MADQDRGPDLDLEQGEEAAWVAAAVVVVAAPGGAVVVAGLVLILAAPLVGRVRNTGATCEGRHV